MSVVTNEVRNTVRVPIHLQMGQSETVYLRTINICILKKLR